MNWKCFLFGHRMYVGKDQKSIICSRENKRVDLAIKGCADELIRFNKTRCLFGVLTSPTFLSGLLVIAIGIKLIIEIS